MNIRTPRSRFAPVALAALFAFTASFAGINPASARDSYVKDGAGLFKASTVSTLNSSIADLQRTTGKEIVVVTVPSLSGADPRTAVENVFSQEQVNGVLFYFAKEEKKDYVLGDTASRSFFKAGAFQDVHNAMRGYLRSGDPDTAVITGVNLVEDTYKGHAGSAVRSGSRTYETHTSQGGFGMGWIWLGLILLAGFLIIRAIFRAMAGPRMMPPGYGGPGYGGPGYGGQGFGGGYGGGGGGGSFFSGLLGGLGGAFIGNELFGRRDEFGGGQNAGFGDNGGGGGYSNDNSGFQSDAGQADMGGMGGGDWGGGSDSGGGGGDSGGGW